MRSLFIISFFFMFYLQAQTPMNETEALTLKTLVKQQAKTTKTISSDFVQYKHMDFLSNDIVTEGTLHFKVPNLIKWAYTKPFAYAVIFKNNTMYINDAGKKSDIDMSSSKLFKELNSLIINSIKGDMFDTNEFDITYYKLNETSIVHFIPKSQKSASFIKAFHLTFNQQGNVEIVKMIEPSGDYTKIVFSNKVLNNNISDAIFNN
ncbi:outer membrane lipoprotein carrier protein LolA [Bizionia sp. KMM 8389]